MKNLIVGLLVMISAGAFGQDEIFAQDIWAEHHKGVLDEKVHVEGIDSVFIEGTWDVIGLGRDINSFMGVIYEAERILKANGVEFNDQFDTESDLEFTSVDQAAFVHFNIVRDNVVKICWVISTDNGIATLAFLSLYNTGFIFEVDPRYM